MEVLLFLAFTSFIGVAKANSGMHQTNDHANAEVLKAAGGFNPCSINPCHKEATCSVEVFRTIGFTCGCNKATDKGFTHCYDNCQYDKDIQCPGDLMKCDLVDGKPTCVCVEGSQYNKATQTCEDVNECRNAWHNCHILAYCINLKASDGIGEFQCKCQPGYTGKGDDICKDIDECRKSVPECEPRATCFNGEGSARCVCQNGWRGSNAVNGTMSSRCIDTDECKSKTPVCGPNTECRNTPGSFECPCKPGGYRPKVTASGIVLRECLDIDECLEKQHQQPPCNINAICKNTDGSFQCICAEGYIGDGRNCTFDPKACDRCDKTSTSCNLTAEGYKCMCLAGYQKIPGSETTCKDIDQCADANLNDCDKTPGVANCVNIPGLPGFTCHCNPGYTGDGKRCTPIDPCKKQPCAELKNTECVPKPPFDHICVCKKGNVWADHTHHACISPREIKVEDCSKCDKLTQTCVKDPAKEHHWKCECKPGYEQSPDQDHCCINVNECVNPMRNDCDQQATCIDLIPHVANGEFFRCNCKEGYTGKGHKGQCADINECKENKVACPNEHTKCFNTPGSYYCECDKGWEPLAQSKPLACKDLDECKYGLSNCPQNSNCINTPGSYVCKCMQGYRKHGDKCDDADECQEMRDGKFNTSRAGNVLVCDLKHGSCHNVPGSYFCNCSNGYTLSASGSCNDINECTQRLHNCSKDIEKCRNTDGSFVCDCLPGFKRDPASGRCVDINECTEKTHKCHASTNCNNTFGSYYCTCLPGLELSDVTNEQTPVCKRPNICEQKPRICGPYGRCDPTESFPFYKCSCRPPALQYNATKCVDEHYCEAKDYKCGVNSTCSNCQKTCCDFICSCVPKHGHVCPAIDVKPGMTAEVLRHRAPCPPIDLCKTNNPCPVGQICVYAGPNKVNCTCPPGTRLKNNICEKIDECLLEEFASKCPPNSKCFNGLVGHECRCLLGFKDAFKGKDLRKPQCDDIDECSLPSFLGQGCGDNQICNNTIGSFQCVCDVGFTNKASTDSRQLNCEDINECTAGTAKCQEYSTCNNTIGSYMCMCKDGFEEVNPGNCSDIDECDAQKPMHNCNPDDQCVNKPGSYECKCREGYDMINGSCTNINECKLGRDDCAKRGDIPMRCQDTIGSYRCLCAEGFRTTDKQTCENINECADGTHNCTQTSEVCNDTIGAFKCNCAAGFEKEPTCARQKWCKCVDINECKKGRNPCGGHADCVNIVGSFKCHCQENYAGDPYKMCNLVDACKTKKCGENQVCIQSKGKADAAPTAICTCKKGFRTGEDAQNCIPNPCSVNNGGCDANATCIAKLESGKYRPLCKCAYGFELDSTAKHCQAKDWCDCKKEQFCKSKTCPDKSVCFNMGTSYRCDCDHGYELKIDANHRMECVDINECQAKTPPCPAEAKCENTIGSFKCACLPGMIATLGGRKCEPDLVCQLQNYCKAVENSFCASQGNASSKCACQHGYEGDGAISCTRIFICNKEKPCNAALEICKDTPGSYVCECKKGYMKSPNGTTCIDYPDCENPRICPPMARCQETPGSYKCICDKGYELQKDINKCVESDECSNSTLNTCDKVKQACTNIPGGHICPCKEPLWTAGPGGTCIPKKACQTGDYECPLYSECHDNNPGYSCTCTRGFKTITDTVKNKTKQCEDINECLEPKTCSPHAECKNKVGGYYCLCKAGFIGSGQVCRSNSTCSGQCDQNAGCNYDAVKDTFSCNCKTGYKGDGQHCTEIDYCKENKHNCLSKAKCVSKPGGFDCICIQPYVGDGVMNCTLMDACATLGDCPSFSTCVPLKEKQAGRWFTCKCPPSYLFNNETRLCDDVDDCKRKPPVCPKDATCRNRMGSYVCICPNGTEHNQIKNTCDDIDECDVNPNLCRPNGNCKNLIPGFTCVCVGGFELHRVTGRCVDVDECASPKLNQCDPKTSLCVNYEGGYRCDCHDGFVFKPKSNTICVDLDECATFKHNCSPYAKCTNTPGNYTCKCVEPLYSGDGHICTEVSNCKEKKCGKHAYCIEDPNAKGTNKKAQCVCMTGYVPGDPNVECDDLDECKTQMPCPANSNCTNIPGSYRCHCAKGYAWVGRECLDINECLQHPCGGKAECVNLPGSFKCTCLRGYFGDALKGCTGINECTTKDEMFRHQCSVFADCIDLPVDYDCICKKGYQGDGRLCMDINECDQNPGPCSIFADCKNTIGSYTCTCKKGWQGNGSLCKDVDECGNPASCDRNAVCHNTQGSYTCHCQPGWNRGCPLACPDGRLHSCQNVDECKDPKLNTCDRRTSVCTDIPGTYKCSCLPGYQYRRRSAYKICDDINECKEKPTICGPNGICVNQDGGYLCQCKLGYTNSDPKHCTDIDECTTRPCGKQATCKNTIGSYECVCSVGFKKIDNGCEEIDKCKDPKSNNCDAQTSRCVMKHGTGQYVCICKEGYAMVIGSGVDGKCVNIDECKAGTAHCRPTENCVDETPGYRCECKVGYKRQGAGGAEVNRLRGRKRPPCEDIDECKTQNKAAECKHLTKECLNTIGSYQCICPSGYRMNGKACQDIDECLEVGIYKHNCTGAFCCKNLQPGFTCECKSPNRLIKSKSGDPSLDICAGANWCRTNAHCPEHSTCVDNICKASRGYELQFKDGVFVPVDIDECATMKSPCGFQSFGGCNTTCTNMIGTYKCDSCPDGYSFGDKNDNCYCYPTCAVANPCNWAQKCVSLPVAVCLSGGKDCRTIKKCDCKAPGNFGAGNTGQPTPVCDVYGNTHETEEGFFQWVCLNRVCDLPDVPANIEQSPAFNYRGHCAVPENVASVKCPDGSQPTVTDGTVQCMNSKNNFKSAEAKCKAEQARKKRANEPLDFYYADA